MRIRRIATAACLFVAVLVIGFCISMTSDPPSYAQVIVGNYNVQYVVVAPSGTCNQQSPLQLVISTGVLYSCQAGVWGTVGGGGGSGTVTSVTFTGDGTVLSSTPSAPVTTSGTLTASLLTQSANTVFGNFTGSTAAPTFSATPVFSAATLTNFPTFNQSTTGTAAGITGGALGSALYQSAASTTAFIASPTTSGHTFVYAWTPSGSAIAPVALDLATYLASPAAIGGTTAAAGTFTTITNSSTAIQIGSGGTTAVQLCGTTCLINWSNGNFYNTAKDTGLDRSAAGVVEVNLGTAAGSGGSLKAAGLIAGGSAFTVSGCGTAGSITGGASAGSFTVGTGTTNCTFTVTPGLTAPHGWIANADDTTANIHCVNSTTVSATTMVFVCTGTIGTTDLIKFSGVEY